MCSISLGPAYVASANTGAASLKRKITELHFLKGNFQSLTLGEWPLNKKPSQPLKLSDVCVYYYRVIWTCVLACMRLEFVCGCLRSHLRGSSSGEFSTQASVTYFLLSPTHIHISCHSNTLALLRVKLHSQTDSSQICVSLCVWVGVGLILKYVGFHKYPASLAMQNVCVHMCTNVCVTLSLK